MRKLIEQVSASDILSYIKAWLVVYWNDHFFFPAEKRMDLGWKQDDGDARPNIQVRSFIKYLFHFNCIHHLTNVAVSPESKWVIPCVSSQLEFFQWERGIKWLSFLPLNCAPKYITFTFTMAVFAQSVFKIDNHFAIKCDSQIVYNRLLWSNYVWMDG